MGLEGRDAEKTERDVLEMLLAVIPETITITLRDHPKEIEVRLNQDLLARALLEFMKSALLDEDDVVNLLDYSLDIIGDATILEGDVVSQSFEFSFRTNAGKPIVLTFELKFKAEKGTELEIPGRNVVAEA